MIEPPRAPQRPPEGWLPPSLAGGPTPLPPAAGWAPPGPGQHPTTALPDRTGRRRWAIPAILVGLAVVVAGVIAGWALLGPTTSAPAPSTAPAPTAPVQVDGGDVGAPVTLEADDGTATVTVTAARWTPDGELAPEPGTSYLVLDVELQGDSGQVAVGGIFTAAIGPDGQRHAIAFGPELDPLLPSTMLRTGETAAGQLGYQLSPGPTRVEFQGANGEVLGTVEVPGP